MRQFIRRFEATLRTRELLPRGSKVLVAVSGGPDSMTLLSLLSSLAAKYAWSLRIVHVNYHLRGRDSSAEEKLVRATATKLHVPISVLSSRVKPQKNTEEHLREIRYAFFEHVRKKYRFDCIVTAHTQNDVAETVLLNLFRGAGPVGLTPFTRSHSSLVRPLLLVPRHEIERYLKECALPFRLDRSNENSRFMRNRIRQTIIPLIERECNPNLVATLARNAELFSRKASPASLIVSNEQGKLCFNRDTYLFFPANTRHSLLVSLIRARLGSAPASAFIRELDQAIQSEKSKVRVVQKRGLKMSVTHARIEFAFEKNPKARHSGKK